MENALRACCKGIKIGKILIHRDGDNGKQVISYLLASLWYTFCLISSSDKSYRSLYFDYAAYIWETPKRYIWKTCFASRSCPCHRYINTFCCAAKVYLLMRCLLKNEYSDIMLKFQLPRDFCWDKLYIAFLSFENWENVNLIWSKSRLFEAFETISVIINEKTS